MPEFHLEQTMLVTNPGLLASVVGTETLVVGGPARGMTTVVSYSLYELGCFIGANLQMHNLEDLDMMRALPSRTLFKRPLHRRKAFRKLVEERNGSHTRWGFKLPRAAQYFHEMPDLLRNPVFVLCVRNPVAICRSVVKRDASVQGDINAAYRNAKLWVPAMDFLMESDTVPAIIIDMDEVRRDPRVFLEELTRTLQLSGDLDAISQKLSAPGYKRAEERPGVTMRRSNGDPAPARKQA
ncbi:hypothetical protein [Roseivivax sediminis]|uniref:Sulfotransferase family protein n=1 Tax=Roseivivax sediminis TaxID=936889 RepID=A0A1I1U1K3_9RHOB|nr:hypothetical protein [Roseivivax sediminis]SFD64594.1 hypothetical protein SAMN04515678_10295 [Roseivivax sediminis]